MADEIVVNEVLAAKVDAEVKAESEAKVVIQKPAGVLLTGKHEDEHAHYLPPYHTEATFKIAQERSKK